MLDSVAKAGLCSSRRARGGRSDAAADHPALATWPEETQRQWPRVLRAVDVFLQTSPEVLRQVFLHAIPACAQEEVLPRI